MSIIFYSGGNRRSRTIYGAFAQGLAKHNLNLTVMHADNYAGVQADIAVFYGLAGNLKRLYQEYNAAGKTTIFFDLGYWGRHDTGRYYGYHRIAVNALHASVQKEYPSDRLEQFKIASQSSKFTGDCIILAGQSAKASWVYDMEPEEWERGAIEQIRSVSDRQIYYHPKMSWREALPIDGTTYWPQSIEPLLKDAWALATHHSNSGLLALAAGVPVFTVDGVSKSCAASDLSTIESPKRVSANDVQSLLSGVAYWQWSIDEIARGKLWNHLISEGVV